LPSAKAQYIEDEEEDENDFKFRSSVLKIPIRDYLFSILAWLFPINWIAVLTPSAWRTLAALCILKRRRRD
jgi:hypothetical protein